MDRITSLIYSLDEEAVVAVLAAAVPGKSRDLSLTEHHMSDHVTLQTGRDHERV